MKKYILLILSGFFILCSICIVIDRVLVPIKQKKDYEKELKRYNESIQESINNNEQQEQKDEDEIIEVENTESNIVALFVGGFITKVNNKEYDKAYDMLATNFKKINFPTQQDFENYWKENYKEYYVIEFLSLERVGKSLLANVKMDDYRYKYDSIYNAFTVIKEESGYKISFGLGE